MPVGNQEILLPIPAEAGNFEAAIVFFALSTAARKGRAIKGENATLKELEI